MQKQNNKNTVIIEARKKRAFINWRELCDYRDLLYFMVLREVRVLYKQTILGFSWAIIRPVFSMIVFSVVFGRLAGVSSDGIPYPLFSYTALVPWIYFSTAVAASTQSLVAARGVYTKVYFPRLFIPMTPVIAGLVDFLIALVLVFIIMAWYHTPLTWAMLLLPLMMFLMVLSAAGLGLWFSALAVQYRDVKYAVQFAMQLLMYIAPVVWPISLIPEKYRLIYALYPMGGVIAGFRAVMLGSGPVPWDLISVGAVSAMICFISGALYFQSREQMFSDVA